MKQVLFSFKKSQLTFTRFSSYIYSLPVLRRNTPTRKLRLVFVKYFNKSPVSRNDKLNYRPWYTARHFILASTHFRPTASMRVKVRKNFWSSFCISYDCLRVLEQLNIDNSLHSRLQNDRLLTVPKSARKRSCPGTQRVPL